MHAFIEIIDNPILLPTVVSWFLAQLLKVILTRVVYKRMEISRMVGSGGMPSSHSSTVIAMAVSIGIREGFYSSVFAISLVFALVVMTDAAGVRLAASRQARVVNEIVTLLGKGQPVSQEKLKELIGHTPVEVIAGALLGLAVALLFA